MPRGLPEWLREKSECRRFKRKMLALTMTLKVCLVTPSHGLRLQAKEIPKWTDPRNRTKKAVMRILVMVPLMTWAMRTVMSLVLLNCQVRMK